MPSLSRLVAFVLFAALGYFAAEAYAPYLIERPSLGGHATLIALITGAMGWSFLGGQVGRGWVMAAYVGVQTVVLSAVVNAAVFSLGRVWVQGARQRYGGDLQRAFESYWDYLLGFLRTTLERDVLIPVLVAAAVLGVIMQLVFVMLERRRLS